MAVNDYYQITLQTNYKTKAIGQNVFFYVQSAGVSNAALSLANAFRLLVAEAVRGICTNDIAFELVSAVNLFNKADVGNYAYASGVNGTRPGTSEPPFVAAVFKVARSRADMRNGYKRFWGIAESDVEDGLLTSPLPAVYSTLQIALRSPIVEGGISPATAEPIIVKRIREGTAGNYTYRLPANAAEGQDYLVGTNGSFVLPVSSQNTRKLGRGI